MVSYTLTATKGSDTSSVSVEVHDVPSGMTEDDAAAMFAIPRILTLANRDGGTGLWAKGRIELVSPTGEVIQTMEAK